MKQNSAENMDRVAAVPENDGETRAFSKRLNAAKEKWRNEYEQELMAKLRLTNPNTGAAVATVEEMLALLEIGDQQEKPVDPELEALQEMLLQYQEQDEDRALARDEQLGAVYEKLRPEVQELERFARGRGKALGLKNAFYAVLMEHLGELLQEAGSRGEKQAMEQLQANARSTPAALGGETGETKMDYKHMSDEEFGRVLQMALNGDLRRNRM